MLDHQQNHHLLEVQDLDQDHPQLVGSLVAVVVEKELTTIVHGVMVDMVVVDKVALKGVPSDVLDHLDLLLQVVVAVEPVVPIMLLDMVVMVVRV